MTPPPGIIGDRPAMPPHDRIDDLERRHVRAQDEIRGYVDDRLTAFRREMRAEWREDLQPVEANAATAASGIVEVKAILQSRRETGFVGSMTGGQLAGLVTAATTGIAVIVSALQGRAVQLPPPPQREPQEYHAPVQAPRPIPNPIAPDPQPPEPTP